ncbi:hypothetical protein [Speluncibacter jeojiensis]|uniref:ATPase n=1 Tax=Speluncibacter jeojiensis TaxID=2710754 RepID=A0A9X4M072_9ACTN|nr:hypothetical protein [Rhodococcus sp. D2-41]MDG3015549.1 hypothetical protein [Corynebacteriales bacterium D3-21]
MSVTGDGGGPLEPSGRIRRLTQAALNADQTIGRIDGVAGDLSLSLEEFNRVLARFDETIDRFGGLLDGLAASIGTIDTVVGALARTQRNVDALLSGAERVVGTADWLLSPLTALRRGWSQTQSSIGGTRESPDGAPEGDGRG